MKTLFIAGNWKSNKTEKEAREWVEKFKTQTIGANDQKMATIVLCVPYTLLAVLKWELGQKNIPLLLGAQNISPFPAGAYTGEICGRQLKDYVQWVIIGHSERRKYFGETDQLLENKVKEAKDAGLSVIYCVQDEHIRVPDGVDVVAYEPYFAIGTGVTDTPENANNVIASIKARTGVKTVIYGGSITAENVSAFVSQESIDGILPGGASLDAEKFSALINAAVRQ